MTRCEFRTSAPILFLYGSIALFCSATPAASDQEVPWEPANQLSVIVEVQDTYEAESGTWRYDYSVTNLPGSLQKAKLFALEAHGDPTDALSPEGWSFERDFDGTSVNWMATEPVPLAPDEVDDGSIPLTLHAIAPGSTLSGFSFRSIYPPGDVEYWVKGETRIPESTEGDAETVPGELLDYPQNSSTGWTRGPVPSQACSGALDGAPCDDGLFCNGPDSCLDQSCSQHNGDPCPGPDGEGLS